MMLDPYRDKGQGTRDKGQGTRERDPERETLREIEGGREIEGER